MRYLLLPAVLVAAIGCSHHPGTRSEAVPVTGKVTFNGGPPPNKDIILNLQPQDNGHPMVTKISTDGSVKAEMIPGKYVYFLSAPDGKTTILRGIPDKYQTPDAAHVVDVKAGAPFTVEIR